MNTALTTYNTVATNNKKYKLSKSILPVWFIICVIPSYMIVVARPINKGLITVNNVLITAQINVIDNFSL